MARKAIDLSGQRFGMLKVIRRHNPGLAGPLWLCKCDCGRTCIVQGRYLRSGEVQSCGCMPKGQKRKAMSDREMCSGSDSLTRLSFQGGDPYQNLANAIVCVAADDYRGALESNDKPKLNDLTEFFQSKWFRILTRINADDLMGYLQKESTGDLAVVCAT